MSGRLLLRRQLRASAAILAVLSAVVACTSFLAVATPRMLASAYDSALSRTVAEAPDAERDFTISAAPPSFTFDYNPGVGVKAFEQVVPDAIAGQMGPVLTSLVAHRYGSAQTTEFSVVAADSGPPLGDIALKLALRLQEGYEDKVDLAGTHPATLRLMPIPEDLWHFFPYGVDLQAPRPVLDIALARTTAEEFGLTIGRTLLLIPGGTGRTSAPFAVRITGIYEPTNAADPFWSVESRMTRSVPVPTPDGGMERWAVGLVAPAEHESLANVIYFDTLAYSWRYLLDTAALRANQVSPLLTELHRMEQPSIPRDAGALTISTRTGLETLLHRYEGERSATERAVTIALATLLVVSGAAIALTCKVMVERRRSALDLARARGASISQVALVTAWQAGWLVVPSAVLGAIAARVLVHGRGSPMEWKLGLAVAVAPLALVALATYRDHRTLSAVSVRSEAGRAGVRRTVGESLLVLLAVGSVVLVAHRGPSTRAMDPLLLACPTLVAVAAAVVALRLQRYPLRVAAALGGRRRGAVGLIGLASAARSRVGTALPALVLLMSLALSLFAVAVHSALARGQAESAWRQLGADATITGPGLTPGAVDALAGVPGVKAVLPAYLDAKAKAVSGSINEPVTVIAVDAERYAQLLSGTPARFSPPESTVPVDGFPGWASRRLPPAPSSRASVNLAMAGTTVRIQQAGVIEGLLDSSNSKTVALIPLDAVRAVPGAPTEPNAVLVFGHGVTQRALAAVAPTGAEVTTLGMVRGDIQDAPLSHVTRFAYLVAVVASAALTALAVVLWLLLTAPSRTRALSLLGTLGLSSKEARRIATVELVPAAVTALLAGTAVGLTVPSLVGPAIDLTPFVGGSGRVRLSADPTTSAMLIAAFALLIALAAGAATTFSRRRRLGATLRQGEDR